MYAIRSYYDGPSLSELIIGKVDEIVAGIALPKDEPSGYLFLVSRQGRVKRLTLSDLTDVRVV